MSPKHGCSRARKISIDGRGFTTANGRRLYRSMRSGMALTVGKR